MVNTNKTFRRTLGQPFGVTVIALVWIGTSLVAQGQWVEDAFPDVSFESSELAACGCQEVTLCGLLHRNNGKRNGLCSRAKQNVALLSHRETPPGNMGLHFPYQATQMYYYRRPYNDYHVPGHLAESKGSPAESALGENLGYSNHIFEQAHESAELYFDAGVSEHGEDGLMEYVDWRNHQQQRLDWEATPTYHVEQRAEPFPTTSDKPLQKSNRRADDLETERVKGDKQPATPNPTQAGFSIRPAGSTNSQSKFHYFERE